MSKYRKRSELVREVDYLNRFSGIDADREALYGLPTKVEFCSACVISNQRPNSAVEYQHTRPQSLLIISQYATHAGLQKKSAMKLTGPRARATCGIFAISIGKMAPDMIA